MDWPLNPAGRGLQTASLRKHQYHVKGNWRSSRVSNEKGGAVNSQVEEKTYPLPAERWNVIDLFLLCYILFFFFQGCTIMFILSWMLIIISLESSFIPGIVSVSSNFHFSDWFRSHSFMLEALFIIWYSFPFIFKNDALKIWQKALWMGLVFTDWRILLYSDQKRAWLLMGEGEQLSIFLGLFPWLNFPSEESFILLPRKAKVWLSTSGAQCGKGTKGIIYYIVFDLISLF